MKAQKIRLFRKIGIYVAAIFIACMSVFPFYIMFLSAFSPNRLQSTFPPLMFLQEVTLSNFRYIIDPERVGFLLLLKNSLFVALTSAFIATLVGILGGYSVARFRFPGRNLLSLLILLTYMFAGIVLVVPLFKILLDLGLVNTHLGLILSYLVLSIPLALYLCTNYFRSLPRSVEEAALIDGCSYLTLIRRVIIPMSTPVIIVVFIFTFILCYNEYLFGSILLKSRSLYTLPVGIQRFWLNARGEELWGCLNAAALLTSVLVLLLYGLLQRFMVKGLTMGAEKG